MTTKEITHHSASLFLSSTLFKFAQLSVELMLKSMYAENLREQRGGLCAYMLLLIGRCIIVCTDTIRLWRPSEAVQRFESLLFYQITIPAYIMCLAVFLSGSISFSLAFSLSLSIYLVCIVHLKLFLYNLDNLWHIIAIIQCQDIYPSHLLNKTKTCTCKHKTFMHVSSTTGT